MVSRFPYESAPGEFDGIKLDPPEDIVVGGLCYAWETNADPAGVMAVDKTVFYKPNISGAKASTYQNARLGPPSKEWPESVGIYVLKTPNP